jgi:hypothetical protein
MVSSPGSNQTSPLHQNPAEISPHTTNLLLSTRAKATDRVRIVAMYQHKKLKQWPALKK